MTRITAEQVRCSMCDEPNDGTAIASGNDLLCPTCYEHYVAMPTREMYAIYYGEVAVVTPKFFKQTEPQP